MFTMHKEIDKEAFEKYRAVKKGTNTNCTIIVHNSNLELVEDNGIAITRRSYEDINKEIKVSLKIKYKQVAEPIFMKMSISKEYQKKSDLFAGIHSFTFDVGNATEDEVCGFFKTIKLNKEGIETLLEYIYPEKLDAKEKVTQEQTIIESSIQNRKTSSPTLPPRPSDVSSALNLHKASLSKQQNSPITPDLSTSKSPKVLTLAPIESNLNSNVFNLNSPINQSTSLLRKAPIVISTGYSTPPIGLDSSPELIQRLGRSSSMPSKSNDIPPPPVPARKSTDFITSPRATSQPSSSPQTTSVSVQSTAGSIINQLSEINQRAPTVQSYNRKSLAEEDVQSSNTPPVLLSSSATNLNSTSVQRLISNLDSGSISSNNNSNNNQIANQKTGKLTNSKIFQELNAKLEQAMRKGPSNKG